jgi:hypothetical protein
VGPLLSEKQTRERRQLIQPVGVNPFSQGGVVDMASDSSPDRRQEREIIVWPPGVYRWWEDENRTILVYSKSEMAGCLDVSLKTVDGWIRRGAPVFEKGSNGHRYLLDVVAFVEWVRARRAGVSIYELRRHDEAAYREYLRAELERLGTAWRA